MLLLTIVQAFWTALLSVVAGYWLWRGGIVPGAALFALIGIHVFLIVSLHQRKRWAWWLCWIPPLIAIALAGPNVVYNFMLYFRDDPLYLDSPGTILSVAVNAVLFVVPAICIMGLLPWAWRRLSADKALERTSTTGA